MRRALLGAVSLLLALTPGPAAHAAGPQDLTVVSQRRIDGRLTEYTLRTPALAGPTIVRVLLPADYDAHPTTRYPVLYLLHGCCDADVDGAQAWTTHGDAEAITAGLPLIVVMPAGGKGGMYTDWYNGGAGGAPAYETYHLSELLPWIDARYRTIAAREGRVIDGLSMGGFGATKYAARHPDLFLSAASFSGIVDSSAGGGATHMALPPLDLGGSPIGPFGDRLTQEVRWRGNNPVDLAENLRLLDYTERFGNGQPGPLDTSPQPDPIEADVHAMSVSLHDRLVALGIPHTYDDYGPGTHTWPYWSRDLRETLAHQMALLADPPPAPASITYTSIEPAYAVFGWHVAVTRPALEFSTLRRATRAGFALSGSGTATVTTPAFYRRGAHLTVRAADAPPATVVADRAGRLRLAVGLGPGNAGQQDRPGVTTVVRTVAVRISRRRVRRPAHAPWTSRRTTAAPRGSRASRRSRPSPGRGPS